MEALCCAERRAVMAPTHANCTAYRARLRRLLLNKSISRIVHTASSGEKLWYAAASPAFEPIRLTRLLCSMLPISSPFGTRRLRYSAESHRAKRWRSPARALQSASGCQRDRPLRETAPPALITFFLPSEKAILYYSFAT